MQIKRVFVVAVILSIAACAAQPTKPFKVDPAQYPVDKAATGMDVLAVSSARDSYKWYFGAKTHKAFAQSESGAWGYETNRISAGSAMNAALERCRRHNTNYEIEQPCRIINVNGHWGSEL